MNNLNKFKTKTDSDVIAGISTAIGGGIGIIRLSGADSLNIVGKIFAQDSKTVDISKLKSHHIYYGKILDAQNVPLDEVLLTVMLAPKTYTKENVVEINCHGGASSLKKVLEATLNAGARLAEPGEFTKRAFLNGRIDLSQAEAVMDIISSVSDIAHKTAQLQLKGSLSKQIKKYINLLLDEIAAIEVNIDTQESSDHGQANYQTLTRNLNNIISNLKRLSQSHKKGTLIKEGIKTVIAGKPNAGKSSLLNAFMGQERAIVTEIPGTTRDVLTDYVSIGKNNTVLKLFDTAGIRETTDAIELIGIDKTKDTIENADLILFVLDAGTPISEQDLNIAKLLTNIKIPIICVINKTDLIPKIDTEILKNIINPYVSVNISAKTNYGISELGELIENTFFQETLITDSNEAIITSQRHFVLIEKAIQFIENSIKTIKQNLPEDFVSIDLMDACNSLCEIIGEKADENLVNKIFSEFCIGK